MTAIIVRHKVRDYDAWLPVFIEHGEVRRRYGGLAHQIYRLSDDPNDLIVVNLFNDLEGARAFAADPSLHEMMQRGGVVNEPQVWFTQQADVAEYATALA